MSPQPPQETSLIYSPLTPPDSKKSYSPIEGAMPAKHAGFNRVLDGLKKKQLQHDFQLERAAEAYEPVKNIGAGAFGIVCEAIETSSQQPVAIKKIAHASATPTLARRTLREIRALRYISHPNIVPLRDIFRTKGPLGIDVYLVMDLMPANLHEVIYGQQEPLEGNLIMELLKQLLRGLEYLHAASIAHRDLKPSNLLINEDWVLRIADFGMAKCAENSYKKSDDPDEHCFYMTQHVATLPYRAPELLFVMPEHSTAVDMWAVGCIFGEMVLRHELFPGRNVHQQIKILLSVFGKPPQDVINQIQCDRTKKLIEDFARPMEVHYHQLFECKERGDNQIVSDCNSIDFVRQLFLIDSKKRLRIEEALEHPFIRNCSQSRIAESKCPFRVKRDMITVENMSHENLIQLLCEDVRSAENNYKEFNSSDSTGNDVSDTSTETSSGEQENYYQTEHEQLLEDVATQVSICQPSSDF